VPDKIIQRELKIRRVVSAPEVPPTAVHRFLFTGVGREVQLDLCHVDMPDLRVAIDATQEGPEVTMNVFSRVMLSPEAAYDLLNVATQIVDHLRQVGAIPHEPQATH